MFPQHLDDYIKNVIAIEPDSIDADKLEVEGIDRQDYFSGVLSISVNAETSDSGDTSDLTLSVSHSDESDDNFEELVSDETIVADDTATDAEIHEYDLPLKKAKRYLKIELEGEDANDTIYVSGVLTLGGAVDKPAE